MAKKKEEFKYLNEYIPQAAKTYTASRTGFGGINTLDGADTGELSSAVNISTDKLPYLVPAQTPLEISSGYSNPISAHAFGDFILVIYRDGTQIKADYIKGTNKYTGIIKATGASESDEKPRSVVQFNKYNGDILDGSYDKKLLIFPDKLSMDYDISDNFTLASISTVDNPVPDMNYVTVHLSRLWGVDGDRVYASGFNDYTNWNLDTAQESLSSNAWVTTSQSNGKNDGTFTGITTYDGHTVVFKKDFMQQTYNTKNPFRISDITAIGATDNRGICEMDGILFFVSSDGVYYFSGGYPSRCSEKLDVVDWSGSICGAWDHTLYVYVPSKNTVYTFSSGAWGNLDCSDIISLTSNDEGIFALTSSGQLKKLNSGVFTQGFECETDLIIGNNGLSKRKLQNVLIRAYIGDGASLSGVENNGVTVFSSNGMTGNVVLSCLVRMTSAYAHRIKFSGVGYVKIYGMELRYVYGGKSYVNESGY